MLALTLADTREFGILRIIVKDSVAAQSTLKAGGFVVKVTPVVAIDVAQEPGGLLRVLEILDHAGQAIEYMYAFAGAGLGRACGAGVPLHRSRRRDRRAIAGRYQCDRTGGTLRTSRCLIL